MTLRRAVIALIAAMSLLLAGCSGSSSSSKSSASAAGGAVAGCFPLSVDTAFGKVSIEKAPQRVVALGWGDAETALALGVQPVGASDWLNFGGEGVGPWAKGLYITAPTIIGTMEPNYEQIASLKPDLILDVKSSGDKDRHDRLAQIATTVGIPEGGTSYLTTMDQEVTMIATALGQPAKGKELLDAADASYKKVADAHPQWKDKTVTVAARTSQGWGAYVEGETRLAALEKLGFKQNPAIASMTPSSSGFSVSVSSEQLSVFNADLIVAFPIYIDTTQITDDAQWKQLSTVQAGHAAVIDGDLSSAFSVGTTLAVNYMLDNMVPKLEKATA